MAKLSTYATQTPTLTDYASGVDDPGGTPVTANFTFSAIRDLLQANLTGAVITLGGSLDVNGQKIVSVSNGNIDIEPNGTGNVLLGNFTFDADQTVGAGQDNYVLTYDNGTGLISLEAAAGGGGTPGGSSGQIQYNNASSFDGSYLWQDTNVIEQRNSTNAQAFRVYNTYTDASNYERGGMRWNTNELVIGPEHAGTGSARNMLIGRPGAQNTSMTIKIDPAAASATGGTQVLKLSVGNLGYFEVNNVGGDFTLGATSGRRTKLQSPVASGVYVANTFAEMDEMTAPSAPAANKVRIYAEDNGAGKTRLMALFPTGAAQQIAIEP